MARSQLSRPEGSCSDSFMIEAPSACLLFGAPLSGRQGPFQGVWGSFWVYMRQVMGWYKPRNLEVPYST